MYPLGFCITICISGFIILFCGNCAIARWLIGTSLLILLICSMPIISNSMLGFLETRYSLQENYPSVPAIVLLGGAGLPPLPPRIYPELNEAGDRIFHAARLYKKSFAPFILLTGSIRDSSHPGDTGDADNNAYFLEEFCGIERTALILDNHSQNTYQSAVFTNKCFCERGWDKKVILVTSARHMYRSVRVFRKMDFFVCPAPTDFNSYTNLSAVRYLFLPTVDALKTSTAVLHEIYGVLWYRIKGWI